MRGVRALTQDGEPFQRCKLFVWLSQGSRFARTAGLKLANAFGIKIQTEPVTDQFGNALIKAADEGHVEIVDLLLNSGARVNEIVEGDENALIKASGSGQVDEVRLLLSRGADVNMRVWSGDPDGEWRTALKMARKGGHRAVVQLLISAGARE